MKRALAFTLMVLAIMIIAVSCEEPQAPHEHDFSNEWTHDDTFHWHASACGHDDVVSDKEEHKWKGGDENGWIIVEASTETTEGKKHRECTVCGYTEDGKIPLKGHVHTFSAYDHTSDKHWRTCTTCNEKFSYSHSFSYVSAGASGHTPTCYCGYKESNEAHSYASGAQKVSGTIVYNVCDKCEYLSKVEKATTNTEVATAANTTKVNKAEYTTKSVTIKNDKGTEETKTLTINNKPVSIPVASSAVSSLVSDKETSEEIKKTATTTVTFPEGALKVEEGASSVSLIVAAAPAAVASNANYEVTTSKDIADSEAVVAGFEFKLEGAVASDLSVKDSSNQITDGVTVTTYIATGLATGKTTNSDGKILAENLDNVMKVKYIGSNTQGKEPEIVSYNNKTGELVFKVYHFSKYAIVSTKMIATDNLGNMYSDLKSALDNLASSTKGEDQSIDNTKITRVTLLKNATLESSVTMLKSGELDLNGKTITSNNNRIKVAEDNENNFYYLTISNSDRNTLINLINDPVVKIGDSSTINGTYYTKLENALNAVKSNETVTLLKEIALSNSISFNKKTTIDLNKQKIKLGTTTPGKNNGAFELEGTSTTALCTVTIKNGTIEGSVSGDSKNAFTVDSYSTLTLDKVTMNVTCKRGIQVAPYAKNAAVNVINGSNITVSGTYAVSTEASTEKESQSENIAINIDGSTLIAKDVVSEGTQDNSGLLVNVASKVTINNSTISGDRQGVILRGIGDTTVTITDSTIAATGNGAGKYSDRTREWSSGNEVGLAALVIGNAANESSNTGYDKPTTVELTNVKIIRNSGYAGKDIWVVQQNANCPVKVSGIDGSWTVNENINGAEYPLASVTVDGKTTYYSTLHSAILEAPAGAEIDLLCNASGSGLETKDKDYADYREGLTIDFNNNTYTMTSSAVGSSGYPTQAMHWGKSVGTLTLKDGTFKVDKSVEIGTGDSTKKLNMAMQCYIPLTAERMTFDLASVPNEKYGKSYEEPYKNTDKPHFNCYDTTTFKDCTITLNTDNNYGLLAGVGDNESTEGEVTLDNTTLTGNATFEKVGKGSITLKNGSEIRGTVHTQFEDEDYKIESKTEKDVTTYTYINLNFLRVYTKTN